MPVFIARAGAAEPRTDNQATKLCGRNILREDGTATSIDPNGKEDLLIYRNAVKNQTPPVKKTGKTGFRAAWMK